MDQPPQPAAPGPVFLLDTMGYIFRAFHALPPLSNAAGTPTQAVLGLVNMLRKLVQQHRPRALAAVFDLAGPTFRDTEYQGYKANRAAMPEDLVPQIPLIRRALEALRIPILAAEGFEADDVLGTLACLARERGDEVVIVSSDKDLLQLVGPGVRVYNPGKDLMLDEAAVEAQLGVRPDQVADLLALRGDAVDNIPGAPGIGEKGAQQLIARFGSVEQALERAAEVERKTYRESLQNHREQIELSKRLATIHTQAPVAYEPGAWALRSPDPELCRALFTELEFHRLLASLLPEPAREAAAPASDDEIAHLDLLAYLDDPTQTDFRPEAVIARLGLADAPAAAAELARRARESGQWEVYRTIDRPLVPVLEAMQEAGIRLDPAPLAELSRDLERRCAECQEKVFAIAGRRFNLNSPQQLAQVLFTDLALPAPPRRGKTKSLSTASDVLEELADHPVIAPILDYRQFSKLKSTYADALPPLIRPETGRLHTTFSLTGSATGRLSSSNPNLQNIPVRTEAGRLIRAAFVPDPGYALVSADYSQIELRLLAHFSRDPLLLAAYRGDGDIHRLTAAEVFGVPPLMITDEHRRRAKAVNFGIVYGLSAFGLAKQLGIPQREAAAFIQRYFDRYAGVRDYIQCALEDARREGRVRTLAGRVRPIPNLDSRNPNLRGFAERTAINSPLQGTAADLIKLAMIRLHPQLPALGARMLLQVHDELVFEAPENRVAELAASARAAMEGVAELAVPLRVEIGAGPNWRDLAPVE